MKLRLLLLPTDQVFSFSSIKALKNTVDYMDTHPEYVQQLLTRHSDATQTSVTQNNRPESANLSCGTMDS